MTLLQLSCLLVALHTPLSPPKASGVAVGPPVVLADVGAYTSCVFIGPGVGGWEKPSLLCSRINGAAFAEEMWRVPLTDGEPELIGYGRQPSVRGSLLTWVGTEPGDEGIWLRDLDSEEPAKRVTDSIQFQWPSISADGSKLAVYVVVNNRTGIQLVEVESGAAEWLINRGESQPVYSPDGSKMLVVKTGQIWTLAGEAMEELVEERVTDAAFDHADMGWGPRGEWITFVGRWNEMASNVGMLHLPTGQSVWVTEGMTAARSPVISPDGRTLAYIAADGESNAVFTRKLRLRRPRVR